MTKERMACIRAESDADYSKHIKNQKRRKPMADIESPGPNVYRGGQADARQAGEIQTSRFRPRYRKLNKDEMDLHDAIKTKAAEMEALFGMVRAGRYNALAVTALEQSVMWIVKGLSE